MANLARVTPPRLPPQRRTTLVMFLGFLAVASVLTLWMVLPYLLAVTMGAILALLASPVYRWLLEHRWKRRSASLLVTLGIVFVIIVPLSFFVTKAVQQAIAMGQELAEGGLSFQVLVDRLGDWKPVQAIMGSPQDFERSLRSGMQSAGTKLSTAIIALAAQLPGIVLQLALASLACFFFLVDGPRFLGWMREKIPMDADVRLRLAKSFTDTSVSVIWATLAAALAQSTVMLFAYLVLGVPAVFLAAGATFVFAWIPILGSTPVWLAGTIYLYADGA
ncbi:MAG: AI-2E family transporter, partial [Oligoflexia bacterium]|nr:AI-2E family transporter [Oligoflexia bacterium]